MYFCNHGFFFHDPYCSHHMQAKEGGGGGGEGRSEVLEKELKRCRSDRCIPEGQLIDDLSEIVELTRGSEKGHQSAKSMVRTI